MVDPNKMLEEPAQIGMERVSASELNFLSGFDEFSRHSMIAGRKQNVCIVVGTGLAFQAHDRPAPSTILFCWSTNIALRP
jgi:copper homeostasis protein CutC